MIFWFETKVIIESVAIVDKINNSQTIETYFDVTI